MRSIASSSASTLWPGVRRRAPIASIASQKPPAPSPSSARPPLSRSSAAAARARTAGGRSGTLSTLGASLMRLVRAATKDSSVQASSSRGWYGWSWNVTRSSPTWSARTASSTTVSGCADEGVMKTPNCTGVTMAVLRGVRNEHSQGMKERHRPPPVRASYVACVTAEALDVLRSWAVQDSPPGAAIAAVVARCPDVPVGWLDAALYDERTVVALYNPRTATAVVPADEAAAFGTAFLPPDDAALKAVVDSALPERRRGLRRAGRSWPWTRSPTHSTASSCSRDDLHEQLRQRLPGELLPWCEGCQSHHARRGLLVMAALHGRLCISGRAGRQPAFSRTDQLVGWEAPPREAAGGELVRRYRRRTARRTPPTSRPGPGWGRRTRASCGRWPRTTPSRRRTSAACSCSRPATRSCSDATARRCSRMRPRARRSGPRSAAWASCSWTATAAALWRGRKKGKRLEVTLEPFGKAARGRGDRGARAARAAPRLHLGRDRLATRPAGESPRTSATACGR